MELDWVSAAPATGVVSAIDSPAERTVKVLILMKNSAAADKRGRIEVIVSSLMCLAIKGVVG